MLYHGTKLNSVIVSQFGLFPVDVDAVIRSLEIEYGIMCPNTEKVVELIRRQQDCPFVYLTDDYYEAAGYAQTGSNFRRLLELEFQTVTGKTSEDLPGYIYHIDIEGSGGEVKVSYVAPSQIVKWDRIDL